ncbi:ROK family protein [Streptococcus oricebi]|uniref:ROK family protein n=1 Tax=Streptococcus oricebi TaxID=1547447 RepID=A0ABS5B367_9STRE|nr:ROK family protein [Streptococcus oricebi]MBP2623277.1 ROK family protein [Streptococcus oricebi]
MTQNYLTIDIGGSFIKSALIDDEEHFSQLAKTPTPDNLEEFLATLTELIARYQDSIAGVGISCPGDINTQTGYVHKGGLLLYLKRFPLGQYLKEKFDLPVAVMNDGDCAGLAEARYGELKNFTCGAVLVLGTGVGGTVVINGNLLSNAHFQLGELAEKLRLTSDKALFSQEGTFSKIWELHGYGLESLRTNAGSAVQFVKRASQQMNLAEADGAQVFELLQQGNSKELEQMFADYCHEIAYLILNLQAIFKLECVAIGGGISSQALLIEEINRQYRRLIQEEPFAQIFAPLPILACRHHNQANLLGAYCHLQDKLDEPAVENKEFFDIFSFFSLDDKTRK